MARGFCESSTSLHLPVLTNCANADKFAIAYQQLVETIKVGDTEIGIRKGVNLPGLIVELPALSEKAKRDLEWGVELDIDFIAASFICKASGVHEIRAFNFEEILEASGGIMCVEVTTQHVLAYQKMVASRCNAVGKPINVATQMLEYTQNNLRPTRTKVSEVGSAVLDGADCVMPSGELVATMSMAVKETNELLLQPTYRAKFRFDLRTSTVKTANEMHVQLIFCANLHGLHGAQGDQVQARLNTVVSYVILAGEVYFEEPTAASRKHEFGIHRDHVVFDQIVELSRGADEQASERGRAEPDSSFYCGHRVFTQVDKLGEDRRSERSDVESEHSLDIADPSSIFNSTNAPRANMEPRIGQDKDISGPQADLKRALLRPLRGASYPRPHGVLDVAKLPKNFDWRNVDNTNNITISRNLLIPHYYSSFWSLQATEWVSAMVVAI
ncbi:hypothetical protein PHYSODRAFT_341872 [Phytophthora sojae]|uniref:pyruvate kinase n=1 Tax=Phytophthora sojae (strain P6497) TaxID=1094619 RepID=G5AEL6_PHYSP|nr:hypothetical protein PHYSODRAFT_341872 [Phytophthora sojae]EGZ05656.1 hypothetical protein PHYSODRAFT_341872 [Phytophthora sojae]|eukprot:XP_009538517.1 hypothetical protein PHYSODRAFT_341872 [Phytophthora sojae]